MTAILISFLVSACAFWMTAYVLAGVQLEGPMGAFLGALLFGSVNAALAWFLTGVVTIVPLNLAFVLLFGTRWVVNGLLLVLSETSAKILILRNAATAVGGGLTITIIGTVAEYFLRGA
jgi:putative membrane protein